MMTNPAYCTSEPVKRVHSIILVRHGRTAYNAEGRLQGQSDIPLDDTGLWQVEQTGQALRTLYTGDRALGRHAMVVSSDLTRSMQTAHAFADALPTEVHADRRVRERDFGEWEGLRLDEINSRWPEDYTSWVTFQGGEMLHGAEAKSAVGDRGAQAVSEWATSAGDDTDLFVFSHGAWISQTLQTLLGLRQAHPDFASLLSLRNAHWVRLLPMNRPDELNDMPVRWRLAEYNHGPAIAEQGWDEPRLP